MNKTSKWLSGALILSLALNLVAVFFFVNNIANKPESTSIFTSLAPELKEAFKKLPQEKREEMILNLRNSREKIIENQQKIRALRTTLANALYEDPINQENITMLQHQIQNLTNENTNIVQESILQTLINLPKEEREKIANHILMPKKNTATFQFQNDTQAK